MSLRFGCNLGGKITRFNPLLSDFHLLFGDDWIFNGLNRWICFIGALGVLGELGVL